jgi:hypothetical protein
LRVGLLPSSTFLSPFGQFNILLVTYFNATFNVSGSGLMTTHRSDSSAQQIGERAMLDALERQLGIRFDEGVETGIDIAVKPDAVNRKEMVVVEVYARIGRVKGAQLHKIKGDLLKLALIEKRLGTDWRKILCFASEEAASYATGTSWVAEAAREFGIEVVVVTIPDDVKASIVAAQNRQKMVNVE